MNYKEVKYKIKSIPIIGNTYQLFIGNRKISRQCKKAQERLNEVGVDLLQQVEEALETYSQKIVYFADYGTLLGIIRDHHFIKGDMDIDYGIIKPANFNWKEFEQHLSHFKFYKVREYKYLGEIKEQTYEYKKLTIDFFFKTDDGNNSIAYGFYNKKGYKYQSLYERHVRKVEYISIKGVRKESFLEIQVTVPKNAEEYLESAYSKNWKVPDPKWDDANVDNRKVILLEQLGEGWFKEYDK